jgi:hypothetical protein
MNKQEIEKAIETLKDFNECVRVKADGAYATIDFVEARVLAISVLQQQLTNGWIPVSERLPDSDVSTRVYATIRYKETGHIRTDRLHWFFGYFKNLNGSRLSEKYEVIAWKPDRLPEPYKEAPNDRSN